jgi:hypothetical protein
MLMFFVSTADSHDAPVQCGLRMSLGPDQKVALQSVN